MSGELRISVAYGDVELPVEAADADAAMRLADERMYADKAVAHARAA